MKIAVVGSGISGNSAAWALSRRHEVTLYEKRARPGGHSATVDIDYDGVRIPVDTGFIVFNRENYPLLTKLFTHLGVETRQTTMSFSVSLDDGRFEWCGENLRSIFAQRSNLFSPRFLRMLSDILRFNACAKRDLESGALCGLSFGDYIVRRRISAVLRDRYILPMIAAIWSTPTARMLDFPAESLIRFLDNHRLIHHRRPDWETVVGGSRNYVNRLLCEFDGRILYSTEARQVERVAGGVRIHDSRGDAAHYDAVIMATHSDTSLALLGDATQSERAILSAVNYRPNDVWLHRDLSLMPRRREAWAAWNYLGSTDPAEKSRVSVTYWMNRLQGIDPARPVFVSVNPPRPPREELTFGQYSYSHPQFDAASLEAQRSLDAIQGIGRTWYCGAWTRYGFHEDGLASGLSVAAALGCDTPFERRPVRRPVLQLQAAE